MIKQPTIPYKFVPEMLAGALHGGFKLEELYKAAGLIVPSDSHNSRISVEDYVKLMIAAQKILDDEWLGFLPNKVPNGSYEVLCRMLLLSDNIEQAIDHLNRYFSLFNNKVSLWSIELKQTTCRIGIKQLNKFQKNSPFFAHCMLLAVYKLICWLAEQKFKLNSMGFAFPRAHYAANLAFLFDCPQQFQQEYSYIEFDIDKLSLPIKRDAKAMKHFSEYYLVYLLTWQVDDNLESKIYALINQQLNQGNLISLEQAADMLNTSSATLSRNLQELGLSFQKIKDGVRRDLAISLLKKKDANIKDITLKLNFSEPSSFSRAFKQWMGISPAGYLKQLKQP